MKIRLFILLSSLFIFSFAQKKYPKPDKTPQLLFYIQHNLNRNTYIYEINLDKGQLSTIDPIKVSRIVYEEKGQKEPLTLIQRKYAYGVNYITNDKRQFNLSASKKIPMHLKTKDGKHWIEIEVNDKKITLEKIFIQSDKNSKGLNTKIESIILEGKDAKGNLIQEKFIP